MHRLRNINIYELGPSEVPGDLPSMRDLFSHNKKEKFRLVFLSSQHYQSFLKNFKCVFSSSIYQRK